MAYSNKKMNGYSAGMMGYSVMKKDHYEKDVMMAYPSDCRYSYGDNADELKMSTDKLAGYVKKNKMKHY